jgi:chromosome segregation ATPase
MCQNLAEGYPLFSVGPFSHTCTCDSCGFLAAAAMSAVLGISTKENAACAADDEATSSAAVIASLKRALQAARTENDEAVAALQRKTDSMEEWKAALSDVTERYERLWTQQQSKDAEIAELKAQSAAYDTTAALEELQTTVDTLEISTGLLREERDELLARIARRDAESETLHQLVKAAESSAAAAAAASDQLQHELTERISHLESALQSRAAQQKQEEDEAAAAAWRTQLSERDDKIRTLQSDMVQLHKRSQREAGELRSRYEEAVAARLAVESRLTAVDAVEAASARAAEQQTALAAALTEAAALLSQKAAAIQELGAAAQAAAALRPPAAVATTLAVAVASQQSAEETVYEVMTSMVQAVTERVASSEAVLAEQETAAALSAALRQLDEELAKLRLFGGDEALAYAEEAQKLQGAMQALRAELESQQQACTAAHAEVSA